LGESKSVGKRWLASNVRGCERHCKEHHELSQKAMTRSSIKPSSATYNNEAKQNEAKKKKTEEQNNKEEINQSITEHNENQN
jgi:hypothetical protein